MSEKILVPTLGESINEATVVRWLKDKGDPVETDEPIVELETEKVNLEVPSPVDGTLTTLDKQTGDTVIEGQILATISTEESISKKPLKDSQPNEEEKVVITNEELNITPIAKTIAEKNNIDISDINGSGKEGKITKDDVENHIQNQKSSLPSPEDSLEKILSGSKMQAKCGWTAFEGQKIKGSPIITIVNGNIVYKDGKIIDDFKGKPVNFNE